MKLKLLCRSTYKLRLDKVKRYIGYRKSKRLLSRNCKIMASFSFRKESTK